MKMLKLVMIMALVAMLIQLATAADHPVGSPSGSWDQLTDLQTWSGSKKFMVGDTLTFKYLSMHNVLEVTKNDYESCSTSTPMMKETSGNTVVLLNAPGKRYFICGIPGHCDMGMKLEVTTNPTNPPPTEASPPPPSPPTPSKPTPSPATPSSPPPSFTPKTPSHNVSSPPPKSPFAPKSPHFKKPVSPAPEPSSDALTPKASPYSGPVTHAVSPSLPTTSASSTMKGGFKLALVIFMASIAIHGF